ncbi:hypothetical protein OEZ86_005991 [Tetradesmus obliquus]|nr:hypothetical protein OEZ86_005991 [Tetradesmus obliquus]
MAEHPTDPTAGIIAPEVMTLDRGSRKLKASCWNYVGKFAGLLACNSAPCQGGTPYCCNSNSNHATCLQANNKYTCTSQKGSGYSYGWCYKKC